MSETMATRISTVSRVTRLSRRQVAIPLAVAIAVGEAARRLLTPRSKAIDPAPVDVREYFTDEEIERGTRYARPQLALALARTAIDFGLMVVLVARPPRPLDRALRGRSWPQPIAGGAAVAAAMATGLTLPTLPLKAISRRRSIAAGLDTQSWAGWAGDLLKSSAIEAAFEAGGGAAMLAVTRRYPDNWWAPAAVGSVLVGAGLAAIAPVALDPIFNDFTPLPEGETRSDVLALAEAAGVRVGEIYSVDASRRTTAANAYVTGLGPTKRVVLFDTLLDRYKRDEVRVVVAHELGHVRHRDVSRSVLFAAIVAPAGSLAVQRLSWALSDERGTPATLPALALSGALVTTPIGLIANRLSRAVERRADAYSLELSRAPDAFVSFERTIAVQNVADLKPPRWVSGVMSTHPPTDERIGAAVAFKSGSASPA
jgi:STE24 endopeptidase